MENNKISKIEFSDSDKNKLNEFINYEREAAIYDLISENYFEIIGEKSNGPFIMNISVEEGILLIKLKNEDNKDIYQFSSSISKLKKGGFPDMSGDGKVTKKDILIGRGVINRKSGGLAGRLAQRGYGKARS